MTAAGQTHRLASGGLIDRGKPLGFSFDGKSFAGYQGDTLASALIANGVKLVGRSFKYHRPRGILTAGSEEPNALVELRSGARREPNTRATTIELYDGLIAAQPEPLAVAAISICCRSTSLLRRSSWPASTTRPSCGRQNSGKSFYEPLIRRAAGLGRAAEAADPDHYEKAWAHCDVLVAGAGPSGLGRGTGSGTCRRARHPLRGRCFARRTAAVGRRHDRRHACDGLGQPRGSGTPRHAGCPHHDAHDA